MLNIRVKCSQSVDTFKMNTRHAVQKRWRNDDGNVILFQGYFFFLFTKTKIFSSASDLSARQSSDESSAPIFQYDTQFGTISVVFHCVTGTVEDRKWLHVVGAQKPFNILSLILRRDNSIKRHERNSGVYHPSCTNTTDWLFARRDLRADEITRGFRDKPTFNASEVRHFLTRRPVCSFFRFLRSKSLIEIHWLRLKRFPISPWIVQIELESNRSRNVFI